MGRSLRRWQLQRRQVSQRCVAQGTATPPWQDASPNRAEPHNCSGQGSVPAGSPARPLRAAQDGCGSRAGCRLGACCLCCCRHGVGLSTACVLPAPAAAVPQHSSPQPCAPLPSHGAPAAWRLPRPLVRSSGNAVPEGQPLQVLPEHRRERHPLQLRAAKDGTSRREGDLSLQAGEAARRSDRSGAGGRPKNPGILGHEPGCCPVGNAHLTDCGYLKCSPRASTGGTSQTLCATRAPSLHPHTPHPFSRYPSKNCATARQ